MVFILSLRTNEIPLCPCTTKLRFCFRLNVNYELNLCIGVFFLSVVLTFKINFLWVVFPCCVCVVNQAHLNRGLYFSSRNVLI